MPRGAHLMRWSDCTQSLASQAWQAFFNFRAADYCGPQSPTLCLILQLARTYAVHSEPLPAATAGGVWRNSSTLPQYRWLDQPDNTLVRLHDPSFLVVCLFNRVSRSAVCRCSRCSLRFLCCTIWASPATSSGGALSPFWRYSFVSSEWAAERLRVGVLWRPLRRALRAATSPCQTRLATSLCPVHTAFGTWSIVLNSA
jgi:hypothetical protein